jgi:hypothetical protein
LVSNATVVYSNDLLMYRTISFFGRVAVEPSTRSLYANEWNQVDGIQIYDMDSFALKGQLVPATGQTFPKEIQGSEQPSVGDFDMCGSVVI